MTNKTYETKMEVSAPLGCFSRADTGDAPVSHFIPTVVAGRCMFQSVLWWKNVRIKLIELAVCSPIQTTTLLTNYRGPCRHPTSVKNGTARQQRISALVNACYQLTAIVYADGEMINGNPNPAHGFKEAFEKRLERGQFHSIPFFGLREFHVNYVGPFRDTTEIQKDITLDLGPMPGDFWFNEPTIPNVQIVEGVVRYAY